MVQLFTYHKKECGIEQITFTYPLKFGGQEHIPSNTNPKLRKSLTIGKPHVEKDWHIEGQNTMK